MTSKTAPTGVDLQGTTEMIPGTAGVVFADGGPGYIHDGNGTRMFWDGAITRELDGVTLFTDEEGHIWLLHHLIPAGAGPLTRQTIKAMRAEMRVAGALDEARRLHKSLEMLGKRGDLGEARGIAIPGIVDLLKRELDRAREQARLLRQRDLDAQETVS